MQVFKKEYDDLEKYLNVRNPSGIIFVILMVKLKEPRVTFEK